MIVLGPLIVITVLLIIFVVAGKLLNKPSPVYLVPDRPVLTIAADSAPVYRAQQIVARVQPGDSLWVVRSANGSAIIFSDSAATEVIGISSVLLEVPAVAQPASERMAPPVPVPSAGSAGRP